MNINSNVTINVPQEAYKITKIDNYDNDFDDVQNKMNHYLFSNFVVVDIHVLC